MKRSTWVGLLAALFGLLAAFVHPDLAAVPFVIGSLNWDSPPTIAVTEAVLVSGVDLTAYAGDVIITCTLTAARVVGAPLNGIKGQQIQFIFTQSTAAGTGKGRHNVTWNAVFKGLTWADTSNAKGAISTMTFATPDGTNWYPVGAQAPYKS